MQAGIPDFPGRTYIAGTDVLPPESVPLSTADFNSETQQLEVMEPWRVTNEEGALLPALAGFPRRIRHPSARVGQQR